MKNNAGEVAECDGSSTVPSLVNRQLVLPSFIPPKFTVNSENCLIKPSEYLKSIGGNRIVSFSTGSSNSNQDKNSTKSEEQKLNKGAAEEEEEGREGEEKDNKTTKTSNGPPPPPMPNNLEKESGKTTNTNDTESTKIKKPQQPLSAISIHDLHSVQLKRTVVHKTMSSPIKSSNAGTYHILIFNMKVYNFLQLKIATCRKRTFSNAKTRFNCRT